MMFLNSFDEDNGILSINNGNDQLLSRLAASVVNGSNTDKYGFPPPILSENNNHLLYQQHHSHEIINYHSGSDNSAFIAPPTIDLLAAHFANVRSPSENIAANPLVNFAGTEKHFAENTVEANAANYNIFYDNKNISTLTASIANATVGFKLLESEPVTPVVRRSVPHFSAEFCSDVNANPSLIGHAPTYCGGCQNKILDKCFLQIGSQSWHASCARCSVCSETLNELPTCFFRNSLLYCRRDYIQKFGKRCERCEIHIPPGEMVMNATKEKVFHLACFTCAICGRGLCVGETYFLGANGALMCNRHCEMENGAIVNEKALTPAQKLPKIDNYDNAIQKGTTILQLSSTITDHHRNLNFTERLYGEEKMCELSPLSNKNGVTNSIGNEQKLNADDRLHNSENIAADTVVIDDLSNALHHSTSYLNYDASVNTINFEGVQNPSMVASTSTACFPTDYDELSPNDNNSNNNSHNNKAKRMRTSFKHQQLRMMKTYFNLNHNPDAKDLKQLALKTGLSKRVLQVWFQNARAKFRRAQQNHRGDPTLPRCSGSGGGSPTSSMNYAMELHLLSNSMDLNGLSCGTTSSLSGRTSLSPTESSTMFDACSFADDSTSSAGGGENSDNDSGAVATTANTTVRSSICNTAP